SRAHSRELRGQRIKYYESRKGRRLYARRRKTAEPFNQWFKSLFELENRVWHRGLDNNRTQVLGAIFAYQLLVRYNHRLGNTTARSDGSWTACEFQDTLVVFSCVRGAHQPQRHGKKHSRKGQEQ